MGRAYRKEDIFQGGLLIALTLCPEDVWKASEKESGLGGKGQEQLINKIFPESLLGVLAKHLKRFSNFHYNSSSVGSCSTDSDVFKK